MFSVKQLTMLKKIHCHAIQPAFLINHIVFAITMSVVFPTANADCFDDAAEWQGVHAGVLRAIAFQENRRCDGTVSKNKNGTVDIGCMQINSIHLSDLSRYSITKESLLDQCTNIFVGARHYKKMVMKYGNTWEAVGAYHSETPKHRDPYARSVEAIFNRYRLDQISAAE